MRRLVDLALCTLPFEAEFFRNHNCPAVYIGHPFFDYLSRRPIDHRLIQEFASQGKRWVTILPGSRMQELEANFRTLLEAAEPRRRPLPGNPIRCGGFFGGARPLAGSSRRRPLGCRW